MACGGCVQSITNVLTALAGVEKADVSLETSTATVVYDPDKVDVDQLKRSIIDAGYEIAP
jgi:copper chaperone